MEDDDKDTRIAALEAKNKQLERDIAERVRGFLIRAKGSQQTNSSNSSNLCSTTKTIEVQTDPANFQKDNIESGLTLISMDSSPVPRQSHSESMYEASHRDIHEFASSQFSEELTKAKLSILLERLIEEQRNKSAEDTQARENNLGEDTPKDGNLEVWKIKKKMSKLKESLKFQTEISGYAKEGLLLSEQQNYQFRLQIKELLNLTTRTRISPELTINNGLISIAASTSSQERPLEMDMELKKMKDEVMTLRQQNQRLQDDLQSKAGELGILRAQDKKQLPNISYQPCDYGSDLQAIKDELPAMKDDFEAIKDLVFDISNCIPVSSDHDNHDDFFRPENMEELTSVLKRVENYCREIERAEDLRLTEKDIENKRFILLIEKINCQIEDNARRSICLMIRRDKLMAPYARIFDDSVGQGRASQGRASQGSASQREANLQMQVTSSGE